VLGYMRIPAQEEKVAEVERELNEAQHRVEGAKSGYETIVRRMAAELARFQRERAAELASVLRGFAVAQVRDCLPRVKVQCRRMLAACCRVCGTWICPRVIQGPHPTPCDVPRAAGENSEAVSLCPA
jgi:hypothetical protein